MRGEVACHHPFGLGLYLPDHDTYGHVNIPEVSDVVVHGPNEFPPIGTQGSARVLGPSGGTDQLCGCRLFIRPGRGPDPHSPTVSADRVGGFAWTSSAS